MAQETKQHPSWYDYRHTTLGGDLLRVWWPDELNLRLLYQNPPTLVPMDPDYNYAKAFRELDYAALKEDLRRLMTQSQDWWPADYGHYGPFFLRLAWHSAGSYRIFDGLTGVGLGLAGVNPLFASLLFGGCTFFMSLLGLSLGNILARFIPIRSDLLAGIGLLITAGTLVLGR